MSKMRGSWWVRLVPSLETLPFVYVLWRRLWLIALCALVAGGVALAVSLNTPPTYQATSKLLINQARSPADVQYNDILASERTARTYAELMARPSMLAQVFTQLGLDPATIESQISDLRVQAVRDTQLVELIVEGPSPSLISAVANTLPQVFVEELRAVQTERFADSKTSLSEQMASVQRQIEETQLALRSLEEARTAQEELEAVQLSNLLSQYQLSYSDLLQNYETLRLAEAQAVDNLVVMEPAQPPTAPVRPRPLVNGLLAAVVGALLAVGVVLGLDYLDDRIQTPDDLRMLTDLPVLGTIAGLPLSSTRHSPGSLISLAQPRHPSVEAYRRLRTNLHYANVDRPLRTLMVTSATADEGKSLTAANLAVVMAQAGRSVILIDADLRRARQHNLFGLTKQPGLAEAILAEDIAPYIREVGKELPNLRVLTAGAAIPFPAEVLGSQRMERLLAQLTQLAEVVVVDTPPVLAVTDAQIVGRLVDGVVVVIDAQATSGVAVRRMLEAMVQVNAPLVGAVLNRVDERRRSYYYTYGYYHAHTQADAAQPALIQANGEASMPVRSSQVGSRE